MTAPRDCIHLERTHALADGELAGAAVDGARDHLATCEACQAELADVLQLDAAVADRKAAGVISLAWYRRRHLQIASVALAAAAGVAIFVALPQRGAPVQTQQVAVALAPQRAVEARLAWHGAAGYRAYDVPRAGEAPHESIAMRTLADLEARGDLHGVGALALLNGERRRAADFLERAGGSADAISDRAALALTDHQPDRALALADAALARSTAHGPALWNRALALRDLGLSRAAAAAFREVTRRGEPGWADEARERAASLDADTDALEHRFERLDHGGGAASAPLARGETQIAALGQQAQVALAAGDRAGAESILKRAQQDCSAAGASALRCAVIEQRLGELYLQAHRVPEAREALSAAWKLARTSGEWSAQASLLAALGALPVPTDDPAGTALALSRAYREENALRTR